MLYFLLDISSLTVCIYMFTAQRLDLYENSTSLVIYLMNGPQIVVAFAILYLKDSKDVLQELSKLDYLLMISIFQRNTHQRDNNSLFETFTSS